jgi:hypothetical protein
MDAPWFKRWLRSIVTEDEISARLFGNYEKGELYNALTADGGPINELTVLLEDLGTDATEIVITLAETTIATGQTIGAGNRTTTVVGILAYIAVDRALTDYETALVEAWGANLRGAAIGPGDAQTWLTPQDVSLYALQAHIPPGRAFGAFRMSGKIAYRLLSGLAHTHQAAWRFLADLWRQIDFRTSTQFLREWETAVGIPDACLPVGETPDERRFWIAFRLTKRRWNTLEEWYLLAEMLGARVRITPGWRVQKPALYAFAYPKRYDLFPKLGRFRIYIDRLDQDFGGYPYDGSSIAEHQYPIPYETSRAKWDAFRCIIERVCPANVLIIWNEFPPIPPHGTGDTFSIEHDEEFS